MPPDAPSETAQKNGPGRRVMTTFALPPPGAV